jgi:hypothetical protein
MMTKKELEKLIIENGWRAIEDMGVFNKKQGKDEFISLFDKYLQYTRDDAIAISIPYEKIVIEDNCITLPENDDLWISIEI